MEKQTYKLGDVCDINSGMSLRSDQIGIGDIPLCTAESVKDRKIYESHLIKREISVLKKVRIVWINGHEILMVNRGNTCGKIAINLINKPCLLGNNLFKIRTYKDALLQQKYLFYWFLSNDRIVRKKVIMGIIPQIRTYDLKSLQITIPNIELQKKIVALLDPFAELEKELELRQKQYRYYRDLLLREPLEDPLIKVQEYELGEVCEIKKSVTFKSQDFIDSGSPVLKPRNLLNDIIVTDKLSYCDPEKYQHAETLGKEEILIVAAGVDYVRMGINLTNQEFFLMEDICESFALKPTNLKINTFIIF